MSTVDVTINGIPITADDSLTILEAARNSGIDIPTLCYKEGVNHIG